MADPAVKSVGLGELSRSASSLNEVRGPRKAVHVVQFAERRAIWGNPPPQITRAKGSCKPNILKIVAKNLKTHPVQKLVR